MYYMRNTVEERILAFRMMKREPVLPPSYDMDSDTEELSVLQDEGRLQVSLHKMSYFLGIANGGHRQQAAGAPLIDLAAENGHEQ